MSGLEKKSGAANTVTEPMPVLGVLRLLQNILRTLLLTATVCHEEPRERLK
jgi:hypothetical protein